MTNPYHKGPLKRGELPKMALGAGVLVFGTWAITRFAISKAKQTQASALVINRGDRFAR